MRRFLVAAVVVAVAGCASGRTASRGVMGLSWISSAQPPPDHGFQVFAEYHAEIGGARDDPDACAMAGLVMTGAALGIRDRPASSSLTDPPNGVLRASAEIAPSLGGGAVLRCGHFLGRLAVQFSPFAFGDYQTELGVDPTIFSNIHSDNVAYRFALVLDTLAAIRPAFRTGLRFTFERRGDYSGDGGQWAFSLGFVVDWGNRPPGKN
jgi:hypothetical protein